MDARGRLLIHLNDKYTLRMYSQLLLASSKPVTTKTNMHIRLKYQLEHIDRYNLDVCIVKLMFRWLISGITCLLHFKHIVFVMSHNIFFHNRKSKSKIQCAPRLHQHATIGKLGDVTSVKSCHNFGCNDTGGYFKKIQRSIIIFDKKNQSFFTRQFSFE